MTARVVDIPLRFAHCQVVLGDVPTLVDTGTARDVPRIVARLATLGLTPRDVRRIILTHADGDHAGGAAELQELCGAEVVVHRAEAAYLSGELPAGFGLLKRAVVALSGRARPPEVGRWVEGGELIDGLEVVATPGHTPGHISLVVGRTLIAGDAFTTGGRCREVPRVMSADVRRSHAAIHLLAERDVEQAFSGHGDAVLDVGLGLRALSARLRRRDASGPPPARR